MRTSLGIGVSLVVLTAGRLAQAAEPSSADQQMNDLSDLHRHHQHGGITHFVELSLDTLGEEPEHRAAVDQAQADLDDCLGPVEVSEDTVWVKLADGATAGKVNDDEVNAAIEKTRAAAGSIHACVAPVLNKLHAALSPQERAELGEKVRSHWEVWRHENSDAKPGDRAEGTRLKDLEKEVKLTATQVEQLSTALKSAFTAHRSDFDAEAANRQVASFVKAFNAAGFDALAVTTESTAKLTVHGLASTALFYRTVVGVLTAEQRTALAANLRLYAQHHPEVTAK